MGVERALSPLRRFPLLQQAGPEQALEGMRAIYCGHRSLDPKLEAGAPWRGDADGVHLGQSTVLLLEAPPFAIIDHSPGLISAFVSLGAAFEAQSGSTSRAFHPYRPGLMPRGETCVRFSEGLRAVAFNCRKVDVGAAMERLEGSPSRGDVQNRRFGSDMLPLGRFQAQLRATILALGEAPQAMLSATRFKAVHQELLTLHLAQALCGLAPESRRIQTGGPYLSRAIVYLRAHYADDVLLGDVAAAAGCSLRMLQLLFRNEMDTTPMRYLLRVRVRLRHARMQLMGAQDGDTITSIALGSGFSHLGEFSAAYLSAFGERPSQTLARARP